MDVTYDASWPFSDGLFTDLGLSVIDDLSFTASSVKDYDNHLFELYPNPASGMLIVHTGSAQEIFKITLLNIHGEICLETHASGICPIDISALPGGIYIITAEGNSHFVPRKLVIE